MKYMALSCCKKFECIVGDFYCLICFYSYSTENKLKKPYNVCKNNDYCYIEMPKEDNKNIKM